MSSDNKLIINNITKLSKLINKNGETHHKYQMISNLNLINNKLENIYNDILICKLYKNILSYTVVIFLINSIFLSKYEIF